ncbi:reticulon-4 receptor-like 2 [Actinia tenebrosa]|uniref:Reticulon-4 receptor-like 2 n=1 Tax=Actinia tenebrosa TaxID=6105 RepID=A0A6P8IQD1_ACTTE|nr:reticulon-4 receptor-like 2 [Actinia tenebrosa]
MDAKVFVLFILFLTNISILICENINSEISINETDCRISQNKVNCKEANLTTIPWDIPLSTTNLLLSNNLIQTLSNGTFAGLYLHAL